MENMNYEFKDIATIEVAESISEDAHMLIEDDGIIKRVHKSQIVCETETEYLPVTIIELEENQLLNSVLENGGVDNLPDGFYLFKPKIAGKDYIINVGKDADGNFLKVYQNSQVLVLKENSKNFKLLTPVLKGYDRLYIRLEHTWSGYIETGRYLDLKD